MSGGDTETFAILPKPCRRAPPAGPRLANAIDRGADFLCSYGFNLRIKCSTSFEKF